jgi:hypothetical protein
LNNHTQKRKEEQITKGKGVNEKNKHEKTKQDESPAL